eukprot:633503_1
MASEASIYLFLICSFIAYGWSNPTYVYDGVSAVTVSGEENDGTQHFNWTFKYPLGFLCEDPNWVKTLVINMTALTQQADLVLAFGTNTEYFALAIPYDGGMRIPLKLKDGTNTAKMDEAYSGLSVAPPPNSPLYTATTTLEQQYATDTDFRYSLIPSKDPWEWYHLINKTHPLFDGALSINSNLLKLRIFGDRTSGLTQLTITKNGVNITTQMSSTWPFGQAQDIFLFMGMDAAIGQQEIFFIHGIASVDECTIQTVPTPPTTSSPTDATLQPSHAPITVAPTDNPSRLPTLIPSVAPTRFPSITPSKTPSITTSDPSISPSDTPVATFTLYPSISPSDDPTVGPSNQPTSDPSTVPSKAPVQEAVVGEDTTDAPQRNTHGDSEKDSLEAGEDGLGVIVANPMILGIAGGGICLLCVVVAVGVYLYKQKRKRAHTEAMFGIDSEDVYSPDVQSPADDGNSHGTGNAQNAQAQQQQVQMQATVQQA